MTDHDQQEEPCPPLPPCRVPGIDPEADRRVANKAALDEMRTLLGIDPPEDDDR